MLVLRKITENDLEMIREWRMKPEVTQYMYTEPKLTKQMQKNWFHKINSDNTKLYRIISFENKDIGVFSIYNIDQVNQNYFWAYYIAETDLQGKGVGKALECNNYDYAFDTLNMHKVCCEVLEFNEKVVKIHEHFGAKREGLFRDQIYKNNNFYNVVRMGILKDDWMKLRDTFTYYNWVFE